jgi:hypothetical protein
MLELVLGIVLASQSVIVGLIALQLLRGEIDRNGMIGFKIGRALESDELWREVNVFGGRALLYAQAFQFIAGLGLVVAGARRFSLGEGAAIAVYAGALAVGLGLPVVRTALFARTAR